MYVERKYFGVGLYSFFFNGQPHHTAFFDTGFSCLVPCNPPAGGHSQSIWSNLWRPFCVPPYSFPVRFLYDYAWEAPTHFVHSSEQRTSSIFCGLFLLQKHSPYQLTPRSLSWWLPPLLHKLWGCQIPNLQVALGSKARHNNICSYNDFQDLEMPSLFLVLSPSSNRIPMTCFRVRTWFPSLYLPV